MRLSAGKLLHRKKRSGGFLFVVWFVFFFWKMQTWFCGGKNEGSSLYVAQSLWSCTRPRIIPPDGCKSFNPVEEAGALLRLPQPSNELCHSSPLKSWSCCPGGEGTASSRSWYKENETMWAVKRKKKIQTNRHFNCWEFRVFVKKGLLLSFQFLFIWSSVANKLMGVNKDTVLSPFDGDSSLSRSKCHANQSLAD